MEILTIFSEGNYGYYVNVKNRISWIEQSIETMQKRKIVNQRSGRKQEDENSYNYEDEYEDDDDEDHDKEEEDIS